MTLKNHRAPLLSNIKLCVSFHYHIWIQTGVTVQKRLSWLLTHVTLNFDLWPWPFAWTSLLPLVITPENFMMIRWWEHSQKGVTDGRTDRQTDWTIHRAAWSQLKWLQLPMYVWHAVYSPNQQNIWTTGTRRMSALGIQIIDHLAWIWMLCLSPKEGCIHQNKNILLNTQLHSYRNANTRD